MVHIFHGLKWIVLTVLAHYLLKINIAQSTITTFSKWLIRRVGNNNILYCFTVYISVLCMSTLFIFINIISVLFGRNLNSLFHTFPFSIVLSGRVYSLQSQDRSVCCDSKIRGGKNSEPNRKFYFCGGKLYRLCPVAMVTKKQHSLFLPFNKSEKQAKDKYLYNRYKCYVN